MTETLFCCHELKASGFPIISEVPECIVIIYVAICCLPPRPKMTGIPILCEECCMETVHRCWWKVNHFDQERVLNDEILDEACKFKS